MTDRDEDNDRAERKRGRRDWPIHRASKGDAGRDALIAATTPEERIAMMTELAREAWSLAGLPWPDYERTDAPIVRRKLRDR